MTRTNEILEFDLEPWYELADARAREIGSLEYSMRGLQASQVGAMGELVGMHYLDLLKVKYEDVSGESTTHDINAFVEGGKKKVEFKSKERTVAPLEYYDCTVPMYNKEHQQPDYYIFLSLLSTGKSEDIKRFKKGYLLGSLSREEFNARATLWVPGDVDNTNNWTPTIECFNVQVLDLNKPLLVGVA